MEEVQVLAASCDCPAYPAEDDRDCCCIGGSQCIDGRVRVSLRIPDPDPAPATQEDRS